MTRLTKAILLGILVSVGIDTWATVNGLDIGIFNQLASGASISLYLGIK